MSEIVQPGLVSVIVASYNHAEFLEQRMDSLINQTYHNIEVLVIDDCSPDNSVEILRRYESHPKVRLIVREQNGGWVAVSNQGVEMSSGEFLIFANCDDSCDPTMIQRLVDALHVNRSAGIAYCRSLMIDDKGKRLGDDFSDREKSFQTKCHNDAFITKNEMSRFLLHSCVIPNLSAALMRKECFIAAGGFTSAYRVCSDWDLFFRMSTYYDTAYISDPLNEFRQHKTTIRSSTKDRIIYEEIIRLLLGEIKLLDLTFIERIKFKTRVMYLWAAHLLRPSFNGMLNFYYHLKCVMHHDVAALIFLPLALLMRCVAMLIKLPTLLNK